MRTSPNTFRILITLLLIFQVGAAYALPEGLHLNLCFGNDGHIEITPDVCGEDNLCQPLPRIEYLTTENTPHDGCIEFELGCISAGELRPSSSAATSLLNKILEGKTHISGDVPPNTILAPFINAQKNLNSFEMASKPSQHLFSIRSTVLLI